MKTRKTYIDILRIFAIFFVLFNHCGDYEYFKELTPWTWQYFIAIVPSILCKCGPPLFLMISGALLLGKQEPFRVILKHRVVRFVCVLLITTVWLSREDFTIRSIVLNFFTNNNWYLYSYLAFLLMLPFLRVLVQNLNKKMIWLFLSLSYVFYTMTGVLLFFGVTNELAVFLVTYAADWASDCWNIVFPIAGYYLANMDSFGLTGEEKRRQKQIGSILGLFSLIVSMVLLTLDVKLHNGVNVEALRQYFVMVPSYCIFFLAKYGMEKVQNRIPQKLGKGISYAAQATFGVFLLNVFTPIKIWIYDSIAVYTLPYCGYFLSYIISIILEFMLSTVIICIIKKIPAVSKII